MLIWIMLYILLCLLCRWLMTSNIVARFSYWDWTPEQNKLYILIMWIFLSFVFVVGIFNTDLRNAFLADYLY